MQCEWVRQADLLLAKDQGFSTSGTLMHTGYWFWGANRTEETFLSGSGPAVEGRMGVSF